jgi:hypothetical protein
VQRDADDQVILSIAIGGRSEGRQTGRLVPSLINERLAARIVGTTMATEQQEGTVWLDDGGVTYTGTWKLEHGILSLYVGDVGPMSTHLGSSTPTILAKLLLREFLDGAKDRKAR